jgi:hypothetical protein
MNYIKEAENVLWYYNDLYRSIENIDREIARVVRKQGPSNLTAIAIDITGVSGGGGQDEAINMVYKIQTLTGNRERTQTELGEVDRILNDISQEPGCEYYGRVLRKWYIERVPKEEIAKQIGYSPSSRRSIYDIKGKAIRKFAVTLFGIEAVKIV